jgi:hypothetical protein
VVVYRDGTAARLHKRLTSTQPHAAPRGGHNGPGPMPNDQVVGKLWPRECMCPPSSQPAMPTLPPRLAPCQRPTEFFFKVPLARAPRGLPAHVRTAAIRAEKVLCHGLSAGWGLLFSPPPPPPPPPPSAAGCCFPTAAASSSSCPTPPDIRHKLGQLQASLPPAPTSSSCP